jgi:hypothetical protein
MNANTELRFLRYARSTSRGGRPAPLVRCPFVTTKAGRLPAPRALPGIRSRATHAPWRDAIEHTRPHPLAGSLSGEP